MHEIVLSYQIFYQEDTLYTEEHLCFTTRLTQLTKSLRDEQTLFTAIK
jgi:hypothetical protein